jgi:hypothetical protein
MSHLLLALSLQDRFLFLVERSFNTEKILTLPVRDYHIIANPQIP